MPKKLETHIARHCCACVRQFVCCGTCIMFAIRCYVVMLHDIISTHMM